MVRCLFVEFLGIIQMRLALETVPLWAKETKRSAGEGGIATFNR
jgi:hypothetical protein